MLKTRLLIVAVLSLCAVIVLSAQDKMGTMKETKEATITGEVIDIKCYLTGMGGGKGEEHKDCAMACIKGGLPVGILEDGTDKVFLVTPRKGMKGANEELVKFAAEKVKLTGMFVEKGGQTLFAYTKVEPVK